MERRHFLSSTIFAGLGLSTLSALAAPADAPLLKPFHIPTPPVLQPGPGGGNIRTLIHSKQTNGQISCVEGVAEGKFMGPAPHIHQDLDELMLIKEGTVTWLIGDNIYEVKAGEMIFRPHGIVHTFWNASDKPIRWIDMFFHQNFEDFLEELFTRIMPTIKQKGWAYDSKEAIAIIEELNNRYGVVEFHDQRAAIVKKYGLKG
jgi:mannose-6-phosphate isomerase-like protein (cupin superfamily)